MVSEVNLFADISVEDRLSVVRKAVRKATEEALKQVALNSGGGAYGGVLDTVNAPQFKNPQASFNLGMELFGQDVSIVEQNVRETLDQVEKDLTNVTQLIARQKSGVSSPEGDDDQENMNPSNNPKNDDDTAGKSKETLQKEADLLSRKIIFLKQCSLARSFADESFTLSKPALSSNPDWVEASKRLAQAEEALEKAENLLIQDHASNSNNQNNDAQTEPEKDSPALIAGYNIIDSIQATIRRQRVDLKDRAKAMFNICVNLSDTGIAIRKGKSSSDDKDAAKQGLQGVFDVLEALSPDEQHSVLKDSLRKFTSDLFRKVLQPVLVTTRNLNTGDVEAKNIEWSFRESIDENDATMRTGRIKIKGPVHRLNWSKEEKDIKNVKNSVIMQKELVVLENWKQALNFIHRTMEFVFEHVLLERKNLCGLVGKQLFGKPKNLPSNLNLEALGLESCMLGGDDNGLVMENLCEALAQTCIPERLKPEEMPELQAVAEELRRFTYPFVQTLVEMNFVASPPDSVDDNGTRIEAFSLNFEQKYIDSRRCKILNEARNLILKNDYHNTVVKGVDVHAKREKDELLRELDKGMDIFELHQASISDTASKLLALCRSVMDEAVEHAVVRSEEDKDTPLALLAPTLYRAARETLDLFRALIPASHGREIATVPRTAAVLHNDCVFFQYHCLWLGLEYKAKLPPVPATSNDARGTLFHQSCMFVDMVPLFREMADKTMGDMLERQAHQIVDIVGKRITLLGQALKSDEILVEWSEAETALTAGLYHLRHLSETWVVILSHDVFVRSIGYLADALFTLYINQVLQAADISESACHFVCALFKKATSTMEELLQNDKSGSQVWKRFEAIGKFMDMTLMDIQAGLADGFFRSVSASELTGLITATFADGPKRQRVLQALATQ